MRQMSAEELFREGRLDEAVEAAIAVVRKNPKDTQCRLFLAELFCFQGFIDRADTQLETILTQTPDAIRVLQFRQILRAERFRQEFSEQGRPPEFLADPPEHLRLALKGSVLRREGDIAAATAVAEECEAARPELSGQCDGAAFVGIRDLHDATSSFFEVLTNNGVYYWVPFESVVQLEFQPPQSPRDLLWRRTQLTVNDGPDGDVCIPATYFGTSQESDDNLRLARATDWREEDGGAYRGVGQRSYLVGEEDRSILEIGTIEFGS